MDFKFHYILWKLLIIVLNIESRFESIYSDVIYSAQTKEPAESLDL